ncbi:MAG: class I SAM-dependent methyltransferase [Syntrophomonadaceae bacterium]
MLNKYYQYSRQEMLEFVPATCKRILDVGCGAGTFSRQLIERQNVEVWGVEPVAEAANEARKSLTKVINAYYEAGIDLPENYFDCIIFNDVLEHMADPWKALEMSKRFLSSDVPSFVVTSIPNFLYIRNVFNLFVSRDFHYTSEGILDKTHLRFFTKKSVIRLFEETNYNIVSLRGINPSLHPVFRLINFIAFDKLNDNAFLQYAVVAQKRS